MEFSRQEYWNRMPFPTPGDLPDPEMETVSLAPPALHMDSLPLCHLRSSLKSFVVCVYIYIYIYIFYVFDFRSIELGETLGNIA